MIHQEFLWPEQFDMRLWPFALQHAAYLWNHCPNVDSGVAPLEIYTGSTLDQSILRNEKVWGCPSYVLDPKLQDGKKLPKWDPRTRQGQYLGKSPDHASSVGLIRNLRTGYVSPQFHVLYDNKFQTVMGGYEHNEAISAHIWDSLAQVDIEYVLDQANEEQEPLPHLNQEWLTSKETSSRQEQHTNDEVMRRVHSKQLVTEQEMQQA